MWRRKVHGCGQTVAFLISHPGILENQTTTMEVEKKTVLKCTKTVSGMIGLVTKKRDLFAARKFACPQKQHQHQQQ